MIEFKKEYHFYKIWFVEYDGGDWLAALYRDGDELRLIYRFRYYADSRVFDSDDVKNWYSGKAKANEENIENLVKGADEIARMQAALRFGKLHVVDINGDGDRALELMLKQPWMHIKTDQPPGSA